jgi:hypothetical protein
MLYRIVKSYHPPRTREWYIPHVPSSSQAL